MKCPLRYKEWDDANTNLHHIEGYCLKEKCARFDDKYQQCIDVTVAEQLLRIANALIGISEKVPYKSNL